MAKFGYPVDRGASKAPQEIKLPRSLEELDDLPVNDKERDEVSKRLSPEDQAKLMARYGYDWPPR